MDAKRIPILDLNPEIDAHWDELNGAIQRVLRSTQFINGPEVGAFEREVASYLGVAHAVGLNSGTDALVIGLRAMGVQAGDEVITSPFTFFATAEAISLLGATPVFADIDPVTFNIDAARIELLITKRTRALLPVHLYGHSADLEPIQDLARRHGLQVLEDVAQALSGRYRDRKVGAIGTASALSFFPSKNLGAFGDAGLLATNDDAIAERARMLRTHGSKKKYFNETVGYNSRLDTLQAAILLVKLRHLEASTEARRQVAARYVTLLREVPGVVAPTEAEYARHCYHQYTVRILGGRRDAVAKALAAEGIETMIYYPVPLHKLPIYSEMRMSLPEAERASQEVLSLPIWPQLTAVTQERVVDALRRALEERR
jgi:dTDP-4-amino-4,6-dideoxygalactose transaminase